MSAGLDSLTETEPRRVLIVDDDTDMCDLLASDLAQFGFEVDPISDDHSVADMLDRGYDAAVIDLVLGKSSGLEVCRQIHERTPELPVLLMTAHGDSDKAIEAMRAGACDFISKPFSVTALARALDRAVASRRLQSRVRELHQAVGSSQPIPGLIGESPSIQEVSRVLPRVANHDATVLITGESGTGKDLVARAIHQRSPRRSGRFLALNCAAHETLLEAELFGHVKGAFTDARRSKPGLFVEASGGTLFLDEIGDLPLRMQPKLLRVLQEKKVRPLGADVEIPFDTRIVAATNRDLEKDVNAGRFREDLYYRIDVVRVEMPPLRERQGDILLLAQHFLEQQAAASGKKVTGITPGAAQQLLAYDWPGNVRELENTIARAVTLTRFKELTVSDLPSRIASQPSREPVASTTDPDELPTLQEVQAAYIRRVLEGVDGNKTRAAKILGVNRRTLYRKVKRFDIDVSSTAAPDS